MSEITFGEYYFEVFQYQKEPNFIFLQAIKNCKNIYILNTNTNKIVDTIETSFRLVALFNDYMLLTSYETSEFFSVYKTSFRYNRNIIDDIDENFVCQLWTPEKSKHLYENPYLLPCGNTACLKCIQMKTTDKLFKCNFKNCQKDHMIEKKLKTNLELNALMVQNCSILARKMIDIGDRNLDYISKFLNFFLFLNILK